MARVRPEEGRGGAVRRRGARLPPPVVSVETGRSPADEAAFARVLSKFTYPGSPPARKDVIKFVFDLCKGKQALADPDSLVDMIFDKGGFRLNQWGFTQEVAAATDTGRPAVGRGPFIRREGDLPAKISDVPYRVNTPQSRTALAAPSDFNPQLVSCRWRPSGHPGGIPLALDRGMAAQRAGRAP